MLSEKILKIIEEDPTTEYLNWHRILEDKDSLNQLEPHIMLKFLESDTGGIYFGNMMDTRKINLLLRHYEKLDVDILRALNNIKKIPFVNVTVEQFTRNDVFLICTGFMLSLREQILLDRKAYAEEIIIELYDEFIDSLKQSLEGTELNKSLDAVLYYLYIRYVDSNPSEELELFFKLK